MDVKSVIGVVQCSDKTYKPERGSKVGKCEKCNRMVWVTPKSLNVKTKQPDYAVWCLACVEAVKNEGDTSVLFVDIDSLDEQYDIEELRKKLEGFEAEYFIKAQHNQEQAWAQMRTHLPQLLSVVMARLKIWENLEDLIAASIIRLLTEEMLLRNRELLGPGEMFNGWNEKEALNILRYIFGTSKAIHDLREKLDSDGWENIYGNDDCRKDWQNGLDHWTNGFFGEGWGGNSF